jgi:Cu-Zn family superoxide dismutase
MRLRKEHGWMALALAAAIAQFACSAKEPQTITTTATMHTPEANEPPADPEAGQTSRALATLSVASASSVSGDLHFDQRPDGVWISGEVAGLSPGEHGVRIHEKGDCSADDASSAGDPFPSASEPETAAATTNAPSGAGNLGNIEANATGDAKVAILAKDVTLTRTNAILDRSVLIYEGGQVADQATADAGAPVACGVIRSTAAEPSHNPGEEQSKASFSMRGERERTGESSPSTEPQSRPQSP